LHFTKSDEYLVYYERIPIAFNCHLFLTLPDSCQESDCHKPVLKEEWKISHNSACIESVVFLLICITDGHKPVLNEECEEVHLASTCTGLCRTKKDFMVTIKSVVGFTDPIPCLVVDGCSWGWTNFFLFTFYHAR
jgi:hypothetical protein